MITNYLLPVMFSVFTAGDDSEVIVVGGSIPAWGDVSIIASCGARFATFSASLAANTSSGLEVIIACSYGAAIELIATWLCPAKNNPSPTPEDNNNCFSPSVK